MISPKRRLRLTTNQQAETHYFLISGGSGSSASKCLDFQYFFKCSLGRSQDLNVQAAIGMLRDLAIEARSSGKLR